MHGGLTHRRFQTSAVYLSGNNVREKRQTACYVARLHIVGISSISWMFFMPLLLQKK